MFRIIVAVEEGESSVDALAFGALIAREVGGTVTAAHAYPWQPLGYSGGDSAAVGPHFESNRHMLERSEALLERLSGPLRRIRVA